MSSRVVTTDSCVVHVPNSIASLSKEMSAGVTRADTVKVTGRDCGGRVNEYLSRSSIHDTQYDMLLLIIQQNYYYTSNNIIDNTLNVSYAFNLCLNTTLDE